MSTDAYVVSQVLHSGSSLKVAAYEDLSEALARFSVHLAEASLFHEKDFDHLILTRLPVDFASRYDSWNALTHLDAIVCRVDNQRVVDHRDIVARWYTPRQTPALMVNSYI